MIAVRAIDLKNNFKRISELVTLGESVLVARPRNENLVVISEKEYNDLEKARRNAAYLSMLDASANEIRDGKVVVKTMEELKSMAK